MTRKILFSILLCGLIMPIIAQIKGTVTDTDSNPIEFANVPSTLSPTPPDLGDNDRSGGYIFASCR